MTKIIGIVSWLPSEEPDRTARFERVQRLIRRIKELWPELCIMILAQNWKPQNVDAIQDITNKVVIYSTLERLGILCARKKLRQLLLKTSAQYFMLFDDDAIIEDTGNGHEEMLRLMDEHPNGWAFSTHFAENSVPAKYNPFSHSQLNLCCISRYIFEQEDFPDVDPERSQGFEDRVYSMTLLCKYPELRWSLPEYIYCTHFKNPNEALPSTWSRRRRYRWKYMVANTEKIEYELMQRYKSSKTE